MEDQNKEMSFLGHLEVLRWHLIRSAGVVLIFTILAFIFPEFVFDQILLASKDPDFITYKIFSSFS